MANMFDGDSAALSKQEYIKTKVNPLLETLVTSVLLEKPEDPINFMLTFLCKQAKIRQYLEVSSDMQIEAEKAFLSQEIEKLKQRKSELLTRQGKRVDIARDDRSTKADEDDDEEEDEEDDEDAFETLEAMKSKSLNRGARQSVSAEAYGDWNKKAIFVAPVHEKSEEQIRRIQSCLQQCFLFGALDDEELNTIILALKEVIVEAGSTIITQGEDGDNMYLIEDGVVNCSKLLNGEEKLVKICVAGDVFGELAVLYNCPRAASVRSADHTTLWELDRGTFNCIVKDAAAKKRNTFMDFLRKIPLFSNMEDYEIMTLADALKVETFKTPNTLVIQQGEPGMKFYIVLKGECIAKKAFVPQQEPREVMRHKVGDYFGELALIKYEPRAATILTHTEEVQLLSLERKTFKRLLGPIEDILRREMHRYE